MAILRGRNFDDVDLTVELKPETPGGTSAPDSYHVRISIEDRILLDRQFDVNGWQLGHSHFLRLAHIFQFAPNLIGKRTAIPDEGGGFTEALVVQEGVPWFLILVYGATSRIGRFAPRIVVYLTIDQGYKNGESQPLELEQLQGLTFYVTPSSAESFGKELFDECMMARILRAQLGLEVFEDELIPLPWERQNAEANGEGESSNHN